MTTTIEDLLKSPTAEHRHIPNEPANDIHRARLRWLCQHVDAVLAVVRLIWPAAHLTSGYRCPELNKAVGGTATSDHPRALGFDIGIPGVTDFVPVAKHVAEHIGELPCRPQQVLAENDHLHIGMPDEHERRTGYATDVLGEIVKPDGKQGWKSL